MIPRTADPAPQARPGTDSTHTTTDRMGGGSMRIKSGDKVMVRDHAGEWHEAIADSPVEGTHVYDYGKKPARSRKIHDFPVVWVRFRQGEGNRIPWPAEDVKLRSNDEIHESSTHPPRKG